MKYMQVYLIYSRSSLSKFPNIFSSNTSSWWPKPLFRPYWGRLTWTTRDSMWLWIWHGGS